MSRKSFLISRGFDCLNWSWSWAFVNEKERRVVFGLWEEYNKPGKAGIILDKSWEYSRKGHLNRGFVEAIRYIKLIESENYEIYTFLMYEAPRTLDDVGPVKIAKIEEKLVPKRLLSLPGGWYVVSASEGPDQTRNKDGYWEGTPYTVEITDFERNADARAQCLAEKGYKCMVCKFDFEEEFGELGRQYIHVHHTKSLAETRAHHQVDPSVDLVPICPNCHAMAHRTEPVMPIEDLIKLKVERQFTRNLRP